jgi:hypothetical protein
MEELIKIIGSACLKHHDSGESSCNREARLILQALKDNGYEVVKVISARPAIVKSVCAQCKFESECRFKAENVEQNCKYFIELNEKK